MLSDKQIQARLRQIDYFNYFSILLNTYEESLFHPPVKYRTKSAILHPFYMYSETNLFLIMFYENNLEKMN